MDDRLERFIRTKLRGAGRQFEEAKSAYREGRTTRFDLPTDEDGRAKLVCRRHAERRAVAVDAEGKPACFDADHPDCRGCAEDIREGVVETW
ncbi:MAG: hypothetical protein V5A38_03350 [Halolamina sp.]|jgi:hypothetical protein|uniref:DUF7091 family protein n=1 Tax=Halolamina sp. TaxID=1940283 RepID=UPI002FC36358